MSQPAPRPSLPSNRWRLLAAACTAIAGLAGCGGDDAAPAPAPPPASSALTVSVTAPSDTVAAGLAYTWVVDVVNAGPSPAAATSSLVITSDGASQIQEVKCQASGSASRCPTLVGTSMDIGGLPAGGGYSFKVQVFTPAGTNAPVYVAATAADTEDPDPSDNAAVATANAHGTVVTLTNTPPAATVVPDAAVPFTLVVANTGAADATGVRLVDGFTDPIRIGSTTCVAGPGATCPDDLDFPLTVDTLPAGTMLTFTVNAHVVSTFSGTLTSTAGASVASDPELGDLSAVATTTVVTP